MDTYSPTSSKKSKVTLTNWVRLNNAPLLLPRASAVQWNDYVFVLARDGTALLYHSKHNMWSMVSKSPYTSVNLAPALTLHNSRILTMSVNGEVSTFDSQLCQWTMVKDMNMSEGRGPRIIASDNNILYSVVDFKSQVQQQHVIGGIRLVGGGGLQLGGGLYQQASECTVFSYDPSSKWEKICEIGSSPLKSAAVVGRTLFVQAGEKMFKLTMPAQLKMATNQKIDDFSKPITTGLNFGFPPPQRLLHSATACASPTYAGSTLHAIKDTLFSFGGRDGDNQPTSDVLRYNPDTDTWESAGYMRSCRYNVAVATAQDTTMDVIVLGGSLGSSAHIMTQRLNPPSEHVVQSQPCSGLQLGTSPPPSPPTWDNKTSIIEKCTFN
ncbi:uncharacterized protein LOC135339579 [Halichondria panicea]|uniref:uncharacterized protein LOC135339579 n=1 Tax=Halichondria panicea TaxID=6063 RepID=UPI00312BB11E